MKTPKNEKKSRYPKEVDDAIAFLRSMLELVDERRWSHVDDYFAGATLGLAQAILGPKMEREAKAIADARWAIDAAADLLEGFPHPIDRMPVAILKGAVAMIETSLQAAQGEQLAEVHHPATSNQEREINP